jgi:hypothetical protein
LAALYQLHWSDEGGAAHNSPAEFLGNLAGPDTGHYLKLTGHPDGSFEIFNARTGRTAHYLLQM